MAYWLIPAIVASFTGALILTILYLYLFLSERKKLVLFWVGAWGAYSLKYFFLLFFVLKNSIWYWWIEELWAVAHTLLLLVGIFKYLNRKMPLWIYLFAVVIVLWPLFALKLSVNYFYVVLPTCVYLAVAYFMGGYAYLKEKKIYPLERYFIASLFFLWSLHQFDFPIVYYNKEFLPYGYVLALMISFLVGTIKLVIYHKSPPNIKTNRLLFYRQLLESMPNAVYMKDDNGTVFVSNSEFERLEEAFPREIKQVVASEREVCSGVNQTVKLTSINGCHYFEHKVTSLNSLQICNNGVMGVLSDVTLREKKSLYLNKTKRYYTSLLDNFQTYLWQTNRRGKLAYVNKKWEKLVGYSNAEVIESSYHLSLLHPEDLVHALALYKIKFGLRESFSYEFRILDKDENYRYMKTHAHPVYSMNGSFLGYLGICFDIQKERLALKELEEAKRQAEESDRLKSAFLANLSHEIRTPMNAILGFSELLQMEDGLTSTQYEYLNRINDSGTHLLDLINDIIDISKIESGQVSVSYEYFDLSNIVYEIEHSFSAPRNNPEQIPIRMNDFFKKEQVVQSDVLKIRQVLINLLSNAIKFTHKGNIDIIGGDDGGMIVIQIVDNGIGIPQDKLKHIFNRFQTIELSKRNVYGGTGLGLAICKANCEKLGGSIVVESVENEGSIFTFSFPRTKNLFKL